MREKERESARQGCDSTPKLIEKQGPGTSGAPQRVRCRWPCLGVEKL